MKNFVKLMVLTLCLFSLNVNAETSTRKIDANACESVKTNYYLLLEANTKDFFSSAKQTSNVGSFENNAFLTTFDEKNIGYGQVDIKRHTNTSSDGITSWSLEDFYKYFDLVASNSEVYSSGNNMYFGHTKWYQENIASQTRTEKNGGVSVSNINVNTLAAASVDADSIIERETEIKSGQSYDFNLSIIRNYNVDLSNVGNGIKIGYYNWYFQPQVYYVQYCAAKTRENPTPTVTSKYRINYDKNTPDVVTDMPNNEEFDSDKDALISGLIPKRDGYTFLGWATSPLDTKIAYNNGDSYTNRTDITLYAIWQEKGSYETSSVENPKTDIKTSVVAFGGLIASSMSGLVLLLKKGFLRQL